MRGVYGEISHLVDEVDGLSNTSRWRTSGASGGAAGGAFGGEFGGKFGGGFGQGELSQRLVSAPTSVSKRGTAVSFSKHSH